MSGLSGYDAWKTAAPEYPELTGYADVHEGYLTLDIMGDDDYNSRPERIEISACTDDDESPEADDARIVEEITKWLRHQMYVTEFACSSSVDFPEEYGVTRKIDLRDLLGRALARES
jgi:hypothetical protein